MQTKASKLVTKSSLIEDYRKIGIKKGDTLLVHSSLSSIGWVCGGPISVIQALQEVVTDAGTLIMPTHTGDNSDPSEWENPPVPSEWWEIIKSETPAFEPEVTPTFYMGVIPECFRSLPGVVRSNHPTVSFSAWGKNSKYITADHFLSAGMGDESPLGKIYELDGCVLLLGVNHENNSSMHIAEHRLPNPVRKKAESAILVDGKRVWKVYEALDYQDELFEEIGEAFEKAADVKKGYVGKAVSTLMKQRDVVEFTYQYLKKALLKQNVDF
jgi:aminoglycoside 3-N-acetyltransferase